MVKKQNMYEICLGVAYKLCKPLFILKIRPSSYSTHTRPYHNSVNLLTLRLYYLNSDYLPVHFKNVGKYIRQRIQFY